MLHAAFHRKAEGYVTFDSYQRYFQSRNDQDRLKEEDLIKQRFREFEALGLVIRRSSPKLQILDASGDLYRLSMEGIHFVLQNSVGISSQALGLADDIPSEIVETLDRIWTWFTSATARPLDQAWKLAPNDFFEVIPESDRVVSLNHNSRDYGITVEALENVIREFREVHRLDNELGREQTALLMALEGGGEYLMTQKSTSKMWLH
jgi:hypothetical protein